MPVTGASQLCCAVTLSLEPRQVLRLRSRKLAERLSAYLIVPLRSGEKGGEGERLDLETSGEQRLMSNGS